MTNMSQTETKITVADAISELLYQYDNVIVPKFGGFVKEYRASTFDYVQGKISPPSSSVSFNENLKVDDGLLIDFYKRENKLSLQVAKEHIEQFSKKAKITLANREVVSLPKIGRLLKDYENQTKFISQNHNFNTDTFGLKEVKYYPILREIPQNEENVPKAAAATAAVPAIEKGERRRSQKFAMVAIPLAIVLMLTSAFFVFKKFNGKDELATTEMGIEEEEGNDGTKMPVNIKPPSKEELDYTNPEESESEGNETEEDVLDINDDVNREKSVEEAIAITEEESEVESSQAIENNSYDSEEIIFVGLFSKQSGVDQYTALIVANDWVPYTELLENGSTRVGVRVPYGTNPEFMLPKVKARIDKKAFLKE